MAESQVLREFLVALGFKTDEASLKQFTGGVEKATKTVFGFAAAIETTAVAVAAGVARFASNLESLYFASLRTGASASNIEAFAKAAQNFGASASDANGALESMAAFLRRNPGGESLLNSLGVQTRDAKGHMLDLSDVMAGLGQRFAKMPVYLAEQYAGMFGMSDKMMLAIRNGGFAPDLARVRKEMPDFGKPAADAHKFMMSLRDLEIALEAFGLKVEDALQNKLGISIKSVTAWMQQNGAWLADQVIHIADEILDAFNRILTWVRTNGPIIRRVLTDIFTDVQAAITLMKPAIAWVFRMLGDLDKATGGWSTKLIVLAAVLKYTGGAQIIGGILGLAGAFVRLGSALLGVSSAGGVTAAVLGAAGLGTAAAAGGGLGYLFDKIFPKNWLARFGNALGAALYQGSHQGAALIEQLTNYGWTRQQATGIAANLISEDANLDPNAVGDHGAAYGVAQWHKAGQDRFRQWSGHDIRGSTLAEQLQFLTYDSLHGANRNVGHLMRAAKNSQQAATIWSMQYERPAAGAAEAARRGLAAVHLSQVTNIHAHGGNSKDTARAVLDGQRDVNATLVRNFATSVQ